MEERVGYELKRAQQALRGAMDEALRELGLTPAGYAALAVLEGAPGVSSAELARRSFVTAQTMGGVLGSLERAGSIERRARPEHGRILETVLTAEGGALVADAHRRVRAIEEHMLGHLGAEERQELLELLRRCTTALEREDDSAPA
jgi:DNA-binding MarR family transcriptional regulator